MNNELTKALLSDDAQAALLFSLSGPDSDHPAERVAAYLGASTGTLANWRNQGGGPRFRKLGGKIYYRKADVVAWVEQSPAVTSLTELSQLQVAHARHAA